MSVQNDDSWDYLAADCADLIEYVGRLRELFDGGRANHLDDGNNGGPRKVAGSPAPWDARAAELAFAMAADVRTLEWQLRQRALGSTKLRSASDENTRLSIKAIADLIPVAARNCPGDEYPRHAAKAVHDWGRRCRTLFDELRADEQLWTRAPGGLRCPNLTDKIGEDGEPIRCEKPLWLAPGWKFATDPPVYCRSCRDANGDPYSWPHAAWMLVVNQAHEQQPGS